MELSLKVASGKHAGQELHIPAPKFLIGRGEDCQLRPNGELVSRHHCVLFVGSGGAVVRDLNSRNGTFVNDERIVKDRRLKSGDRLRIGQFSFEVALQPAAGSELPKTAEVEVAKESEPNHGDDSDVIEWFKEDSSSAIRETVRIDAAETTDIAAQQEADVDSSTAAADGTSAAESGPASTVPLSRSGSSAKDSQAAAERILKQFLRGR